MTITRDDLRSIDLFDGVEDALLERWAAASEERWFQPGEIVMATGERRVAFKLLVEGRLDGYAVVDGREEHDHVHEAPIEDVVEQETAIDAAEDVHVEQTIAEEAAVEAAAGEEPEPVAESETATEENQ